MDIEKINHVVDNTDAFIQLHSGIAFYFLNPNPDDILIEDISHTLSMLCRFGGHCSEFYSVAEHSVRCSYAVPDEYKFEALMHDAAEAYLVDMPRPIKNTLTGYRELEGNLDAVIRRKFGLPDKMSDMVTWVDNAMLATERRDLMSSSAEPWAWLPDPLDTKIVPWTTEEAREAFVSRYKELTTGA